MNLKGVGGGLVVMVVGVGGYYWVVQEARQVGVAFDRGGDARQQEAMLVGVIVGSKRLVRDKMQVAKATGGWRLVWVVAGNTFQSMVKEVGKSKTLLEVPEKKHHSCVMGKNLETSI